MFGFTNPVSADKEKVRELLERSTSNVYPSREALEKVLLSGKRLRVYFGIDPTGATLHLGHAVNLLKLKAFQDLGHDVIILYGGFTGQIGDPSGKLLSRQALSAGQVKKNFASYKELIGKILDVKRANVRFLDNENWTNKLKPRDIIDLASQFTVAQLLERDMFQDRIKQGKEIYLHEFLYPIFQAYDAVTMDVDVQLGGNDQTFNMLAGRTLMRKLKNKEKFVVATKLLTDPSGKKMGKTEGNMVGLDETADDMFGKIMSWNDSIILSALELCTKMTDLEIGALKTKLEQGMNPRDVKVGLAKEIVTLYHDASAGNKAADNFEKTFSKGEMPADAPVAQAQKGEVLVDVLIKAGAVPSKSEFYRLVKAGAVSIVGGDTITDEKFVVEKSLDIRVGKHRFVRIKLKLA
ncbi:MAG: tyrosine--tRNA ligase [Candidatus Taylorbacteria bacterium RIFCSPHIGHO2_02_FULL_46_13]|uniref:Tyrosine--tRNA ligase n=1 Tax=Candidatus Taylorbacteria bacterium RIFCSPHIGHO2_02_FULL_46_13 TaxID=1802312 RepID=A0A1G2MQP7_9BACT|nr:MAG: tyrosine--tRNA ligase [Candidatus Taylorbacteria bacterium RIFCSPHIGHO2_02_FULL_46_13]